MKHSFIYLFFQLCPSSSHTQCLWAKRRLFLLSCHSRNNCDKNHIKMQILTSFFKCVLCLCGRCEEKLWAFYFTYSYYQGLLQAKCKYIFTQLFDYFGFFRFFCFLFPSLFSYVFSLCIFSCGYTANVLTIKTTETGNCGDSAGKICTIYGKGL